MYRGSKSTSPKGGGTLRLENLRLTTLGGNHFDRFPKNFIMLSFDCYSGTIDPIQHLRQYQDKTPGHFHGDFLLNRVFPSNLKGTAYDWFYSLLRHSLQSFEEVERAFCHQYASRREFKRNNNHFFTIKMKHRENLKYYISYFQSQMASVYNCNDDVSALHSSGGCKSPTPTNTW